TATACRRATCSRAAPPPRLTSRGGTFSLPHLPPGGALHHPRKGTEKHDTEKCLAGGPEKYVARGRPHRPQQGHHGFGAGRRAVRQVTLSRRRGCTSPR